MNSNLYIFGWATNSAALCGSVLLFADKSNSVSVVLMGLSIRLRIRSALKVNERNPYAPSNSIRHYSLLVYFPDFIYLEYNYPLNIWYS